MRPVSKNIMSQMEEYNARIIAGAADLFRMYGIKSVTMDDIASRLGISKRSIYERFKDKDSLLFAVINSMIEKQREAIERILADSPDVITAIFTIIRMGRDHAAAMNPLISADLKKYHSKVMQKLKEKCGHPDYESAGRILEKGISQGIFRSDIHVEIVSRAFRGIISLTRNEELFPRERFMQRDLVQNIIVNFMRGISTPRGIELIDSMENEI